MQYIVMLDEEEIARLKVDVETVSVLEFAAEIVTWASGIAELPAWGAFFYAEHGRLPDTLDEWTAWRDGNLERLQALAPRE